MTPMASARFLKVATLSSLEDQRKPLPAAAPSRLAQAVRRERRGDLVALVGEQAATRSGAAAARRRSRRRPRAAAAGAAGWRRPSARRACGVRAGPGAATSSATPLTARCRASHRRPAGRSRTPSTGSQPSLAAAIASTPEPQPTSTSGRRDGLRARAAARGTAASSGARRCRRPARGRSRSRRCRRLRRDPRRAHAQPAADLAPAGGTRFQRSAQSSAISVVVTSTSAPPAAARRSGSAGQLAGRAVDRVLDDVAVVDLLHAARRELEQLGEHELGVGAADPQREADHVVEQPALSLPTSDSSSRRFSSVDRVGELLDQRAAAPCSAARDDHVDDHAQVAVRPRRRRRGMPLPPDGRDRSPGCVPGGNLDVDVAVERSGALSVAPERRRRGGHVEHGDEVVAVAHEALVGQPRGRARRGRRAGRRARPRGRGRRGGCAGRRRSRRERRRAACGGAPRVRGPRTAGTAARGRARRRRTRRRRRWRTTCPNGERD